MLLLVVEWSPHESLLEYLGDRRKELLLLFKEWGKIVLKSFHVYGLHTYVSFVFDCHRLYSLEISCVPAIS